MGPINTLPKPHANPTHPQRTPTLRRPHGAAHAPPLPLEAGGLLGKIWRLAVYIEVPVFAPHYPVLTEAADNPRASSPPLAAQFGSQMPAGSTPPPPHPPPPLGKAAGFGFCPKRGLAPALEVGAQKEEIPGAGATPEVSRSFCPRGGGRPQLVVRGGCQRDIGRDVFDLWGRLMEKEQRARGQPGQ